MQPRKVTQYDSSPSQPLYIEVESSHFLILSQAVISAMNQNIKPLRRSGQSTSISAFQPLPRLPPELIIQIFEDAALCWLSSSHAFTSPSHHSFGTHLIVYKTPPLRYISRELRPKSEYVNFAGREICKIAEIQTHNEALKTRRVLPPLLHVDTLARGLMYKAILTANRQAWDLELRPNTALYLEDCLTPSAPDFGLRIQDFRRPGLEKRISKEASRLAESRQQYIEETKKKRWSRKRQIHPCRNLSHNRAWMLARLGPRSLDYFVLPGNAFYKQSRPPAGYFWEPISSSFRPSEENLRWDYGREEVMRLAKCEVHHDPLG